MKAATSCGCVFGLLNFAKDRRCQAIAPADELEPRTALLEPFCFEAQESSQQPEDALNLGNGPAPVVGRKRIDSEAVDTHVRCMLHNTPQRSDSGAMACNAGQSAPRSPATISVHNDCNV
jgi:hypothetical protein